MKLCQEKQAMVLSCLIEGNSIRSTTRITGVAKNTVVKLLAEAGEACSAYHDDHMIDLPCTTLQFDEIWSFVGCKQKNVESTKGKHPGDVWTWTSLCADTKLIPVWRVGDRSANTAYDFCADLSGRFTDRVQVTTDGLGHYQWAIGANFKDVDYARLIKIYGNDADGNSVVTGIRKEPVLGTPDMDLVNTSFVERSNLSIRMCNRRFTRLTNAFSKKVENHCHMLALGFMSYNFCRKHGTLKTTPAVAAGLSGDVWTLRNVVEMMDDYFEAKQEAEFEAAFEDKFTASSRYPKTYEPQQPKTPWYLDRESGGKNPPTKKPGISYD